MSSAASPGPHAGSSHVPPGTPVDPRHSGHAHLVVLHPPFAAPLLPDERPTAAPAHDPEAARAAALSLSTVAAVRDERGPSRLDHPSSPASRAELDVVSVAAWGSTLKITDPALVEDGMLSSTLEDEFRSQRRRHPDARVVAVCERDFGAAYLKILAAVPGAPDLTIEGFDELETTGDPRATLAAAGFGLDDLDAEDGPGHAVDADGIMDHDAFLHMLTGGALSVYADEERDESTFVVERTEDGEHGIREVWFPQD
ncbi:DUF6333 family protein [Streptomyces beihaiensis]|uniref:DUF6333 family protein n=1 Tax=Streptomyces beihaiensis TaxID=2984495 RepID=A0ABT3TUK7_9ACTN|nr:DUF6333 family protein [Streptomyces beihaiensis]MCX3060710.1 DUF6333 family protein [Streptomyces beihaiensis]